MMKPAATKSLLLADAQSLTNVLREFLDPQHKRLLLWVSLWAAALSLVEMLVAVAVVPYVQCVGGNCPAALVKMVDGWPITLVLSGFLFLLITLKFVAQGLLTWTTSNFHQKVQRDTVSRLLRGYLHLDWASFQSQHRAHYLRRCFTTAIDASYVSQQAVTLISSTLMLLFLTAVLLWHDAVVAFGLGVCMLILGIGSQQLIGRAQNKFAHERELATQRWNIGLAECLGSFREIRVYGLERFFLDQLDRALDSVAHSNRRLSFLPNLPRMVLEFGLFAVLLTLISVWVFLERPIAELLPQIIFYAFVVRALMPAMINLLSTRAVLAGSIVNIELILQEFNWAAARQTKRIGIDAVPAKQSLFALENVTFHLVSDKRPVVENMNVRLSHPSWLALTGPSGVGKSTVMELLCGIHTPQSGRVVHAWAGGAPPRIAYLPQQVALLDGSIADNVVFGFDGGDAAKIDQALELACLTHLVSMQPGGVNARVGADGAQLSGGERQRLALARALYRNPDLLLLDEATSGLDEATETQVLSAVKQARPAMSVVFVTHRHACLRFADQVIALAMDRSGKGAVQEVRP
jgi:ABC-type bacteriocin/lantibiotic exporter with double-glycine peptidase domain